MPPDPPPQQLLCGSSHVPSQSQVSFTAYEPVFNLVLLGWPDSIAKSKLEWISQDRYPTIEKWSRCEPSG